MRRLTRPRMRLAWDYVVAGVVVALMWAGFIALAYLGHGWGLNG